MIRGYGPRKPKQQRKEKRKDLPFARVSAEIQLDSTKEVAESRVFLNDLSPTGVGCFVIEPIDKGEKVSLVIEQPKHLFVKGEIMWCTPYTLDTKIISSEQFRYRVGIRFEFESTEEAAAVKAFCEELYAQKK